MSGEAGRVGGHPSNAVPAHLAGLGSIEGAVADHLPPSPNVIVQAGGVDWVGEPARCAHTTKRTGWPCEAPPLEGKGHCAAHRKVAEREKLEEDE